MYTSNLTELLWMLNEMQKNWVIHIELPATEEASSGESWQAQLYFLEGKVTTCQVQSSMDGRRLVTGWEAIRWLINLPHLAWKLEALTSPHASSQTFNGSQVLLPPPSWVPQRIAQAEQKVIHSWSRKQRQVFTLVDGKRSAEKIAHILCQPLAVVESILDELQSMGVITRE